MNQLKKRQLALLVSWPVYIICFFLTEILIPQERCFLVYCPLDDWIPFCELFLIPYAAWYGLIVFSLAYFALCKKQSFVDLSRYILFTQAVCMAAYIFFPTCQQLRPESFPRDNLLTRGVELLYRIDTNTGVCPSFHVACSVAIASVWLKTPEVRLLWKGSIVAMAGLICLSTMFLKQHSAVDFFAALLVCAAAEGILFRKRGLRKR